MRKKLEPMFETDITGKTTTCVLSDGDYVFYGIASCHDDDMEFRSKLVGQEIAYMRALIQFWRHCRDNEIKPKLAVLKHLLCTMKYSKQFNPKSYEAKMLFRQINMYEDLLDTVKEEIQNIKDNISFLIKEKEETYTKFRNSRKRKAFEQRLKEIEKKLDAENKDNLN